MVNGSSGEHSSMFLRAGMFIGRLALAGGITGSVVYAASPEVQNIVADAADHLQDALCLDQLVAGSTELSNS